MWRIGGLWLLIIPFVSFFGLSQGRNWIDMLFQWTPSEHVESLLGLMAEINAALGGYMRTGYGKHVRGTSDHDRTLVFGIG